MFAAFVLVAFTVDPAIDQSSFTAKTETYNSVAVQQTAPGYDISETLTRDGRSTAVKFAVEHKHRHLIVKSDVANVAAIPISLFADECKKHGVTFAVEYVVNTSVQMSPWEDSNQDYRERQLFYFSQVALRDCASCTGIIIRASKPIDPKDEKSQASEQFRRVVENCERALTTNQPAATEGAA